MTINDIQAAIIVNSAFGTEVSFQHIYFARANPGGDEYAAGSNKTTPCSSNPCQNGGLCVVDSRQSSFNCLCTAGNFYFLIVYVLFYFTFLFLLQDGEVIKRNMKK